LEEDIEWGDIVFGAGSTVSAGSSLTLTKLFAGRHRDISGKDYDLGVGGGIYWLSMNTFIEGSIIESGIPIETRRTARTEGPLPSKSRPVGLTRQDRDDIRRRLHLPERLFSNWEANYLLRPKLQGVLPLLLHRPKLCL
jgi:hypothetical protein